MEEEVGYESMKGYQVVEWLAKVGAKEEGWVECGDSLRSAAAEIEPGGCRMHESLDLLTAMQFMELGEPRQDPFAASTLVQSYSEAQKSGTLRDASALSASERAGVALRLVALQAAMFYRWKLPLESVFACYYTHEPAVVQDELLRLIVRCVVVVTLKLRDFILVTETFDPEDMLRSMAGMPEYTTKALESPEALLQEIDPQLSCPAPEGSEQEFLMWVLKAQKSWLCLLRGLDDGGLEASELKSIAKDGEAAYAALVRCRAAADEGLSDEGLFEYQLLTRTAMDVGLRKVKPEDTQISTAANHVQKTFRFLREFGQLLSQGMRHAHGQSKNADRGYPFTLNTLLQFQQRHMLGPDPVDVIGRSVFSTVSKRAILKGGGAEAWIRLCMEDYGFPHEWTASPEAYTLEEPLGSRASHMVTFLFALNSSRVYRCFLKDRSRYLQLFQHAHAADMGAEAHSQFPLKLGSIPERGCTAYRSYLAYVRSVTTVPVLLCGMHQGLFQTREIPFVLLALHAHLAHTLLLLQDSQLFFARLQVAQNTFRQQPAKKKPGKPAKPVKDPLAFALQSVPGWDAPSILLAQTNVVLGSLLMLAGLEKFCLRDVLATPNAEASPEWVERYVAERLAPFEALGAMSFSLESLRKSYQPLFRASHVELLKMAEESFQQALLTLPKVKAEKHKRYLPPFCADPGLPSVLAEVAEKNILWCQLGQRGKQDPSKIVLYRLCSPLFPYLWVFSLGVAKKPPTSNSSS